MTERVTESAAAGVAATATVYRPTWVESALSGLQYTGSARHRGGYGCLPSVTHEARVQPHGHRGRFMLYPPAWDSVHAPYRPTLQYA